MIKGTFDGDKNYYLLFTAEAAKFDSFVPAVQKMINSFDLPPSPVQPGAGIVNKAGAEKKFERAFCIVLYIL
jgi:hypothetical protein